MANWCTGAARDVRQLFARYAGSSTRECTAKPSGANDCSEFSNPEDHRRINVEADDEYRQALLVAPPEPNRAPGYVFNEKNRLNRWI